MCPTCSNQQELGLQSVQVQYHDGPQRIWPPPLAGGFVTPPLSTPTMPGTEEANGSNSLDWRRGARHSLADALHVSCLHE